MSLPELKTRDDYFRYFYSGNTITIVGKTYKHSLMVGSMTIKTIKSGEICAIAYVYDKNLQGNPELQYGLRSYLSVTFEDKNVIVYYSYNNKNKYQSDQYIRVHIEKILIDTNTKVSQYHQSLSKNYFLEFYTKLCSFCMEKRDLIKLKLSQVAGKVLINEVVSTMGCILWTEQEKREYYEKRIKLAIEASKLTDKCDSTFCDHSKDQVTESHLCSLNKTFCCLMNFFACEDYTFTEVKVDNNVYYTGNVNYTIKNNSNVTYIVHNTDHSHTLIFDSNGNLYIYGPYFRGVVTVEKHPFFFAMWLVYIQKCINIKSIKAKYQLLLENKIINTIYTKICHALKIVGNKECGLNKFDIPKECNITKYYLCIVFYAMLYCNFKSKFVNDCRTWTVDEINAQISVSQKAVECSSTNYSVSDYTTTIPELCCMWSQLICLK